jgi:hypothetical protein
MNRPGAPSGLSICPACNGTGLSPSSFNGVWAIEPKKLDLPNKMMDAIPQLAKIEAQMGLGGSEIIEITKHKVETIGTVMNDWGAIRVDPAGKMEPAYCMVAPGATLLVRKESPLIEQVQVDDLPGGTYTLNVCNRYNVLVGAGGLNLKSYGVVNISGAMTNIAGEQVNIGSANEVNIDGGKRLSLVGDIIHIKQRFGEQVLLDGDVGISGKLIVKGGVYIEGNLAAQQTDTPQRKRQTDPITVSGGPVSDMCTGVGIPMDTYGIVRDPVSRQLTPGGGGKAYMGYTDKEVPTIGIPTNTVIAQIPVGATITGPVGVGLTSATGGPVTGTLSCTLTQAIDVVITSAVVKDVQGCASGAGITFGGTDKTHLSLRGLPPNEVNKLVEASKIPTSGGANQFPIMNLGTGAHVDSHGMSKHTHSFDDGNVGSNAALRSIGMGSMLAIDGSHFGDIKVAKTNIV